jgi:hypothetical protein
MSFRRTINEESLWTSHCERNSELLSLPELPYWIFEKEGNFRVFATNGQTNESGDGEVFNFDELDEEIFWNLFDFITSYFEMDMSLFNKFEESRIKRKKTNPNNL